MKSSVPLLMFAIAAVPGEYLVRLRDGVKDGAALNRLQSASWIQEARPLRTEPMLVHVTTVMPNALETLQALPEVEIAEPNIVLEAFQAPATAETRPNDPRFEKQWNLSNTGQKDFSNHVGVPGMDLGMLEAWARGHTGRREVTVAVVDTGIDLVHPDLRDNLFINAAENPGKRNRRRRKRLHR